MKRHNDGNWMALPWMFVVAAFVTCLANSIFLYLYHKFRDGLARSLKMEAIFLVNIILNIKKSIMS